MLLRELDTNGVLKIVGFHAIIWLGLTLDCAIARAAEKPEYNRDIRPILAENCFNCHGASSASRKADLRLDRRNDAIKAGAIAPGKPEESALVERIFSQDKDERMPPPAAHKTLTEAQRQTLKAWIANGAEYQPLWSFLPPVKPALPTVKDPAWARTPIDRFVLATLEKRGMPPAPEADRPTLARRVSLDLTGLPPSPAVVDAFVADRRPDAYERLVDTLLAMPQYGEHRARYWLDAARYADTNGIHFDNFREIWSYRDWVIAAFNRNLPFDQFTVEQLAGDLLPHPTIDQQVATGFNRCNTTTNEGGAIAEEYLVLYTRDRTETTSRVWLGFTAGCAVCHDHKFDPLSQKEFYQMSAFFNNTTQAAMDGNIKDTPPVMVVPRGEDGDRWSVVSRDVAEIDSKAEARKKAAQGDFDKWLATAAPKAVAATIPTAGLKLHAALDEGKGRSLKVTIDNKSQRIGLAKVASWKPGHVAANAFNASAGVEVAVPGAGDFEAGQPFSYGAWILLDKKAKGGAIFSRMDDAHGFRGWDLWLEPKNRIAAHIIDTWPDNAIKVSADSRLKPGRWYHVMVTYDGSRKGSGVNIYIDGKPEKTSAVPDKLTGTTRTKVPLKLAQRNVGNRVENVAIQDVRIYGRLLPEAEVQAIMRATRAVWLAAKPAKNRTVAEKNELFDWWLPQLDKVYAELAARRSKLSGEERALKARGTVAHVMHERDGKPGAFVLYRGEYDKRREAVEARTPAFLPPMPDNLPRNRLGFAQWLLRPDQPLTARVTVNRFWQEIFGTGLVKTTEDFGTNGETPANPELLDWLAVDFRESGWDVKRLMRMIVTSAAYRQAAVVTPEKLERDPQNRLLSRGPRFRMDGEMVRDYALAASGLLAPKIGGPSVRPYQPEGIWEAVAMPESNTRLYRRDSGEGLYRRSLYTFWKRAAPPASMEVFNAPTREACTVRRERTNTPLQALATLNDEQYVEAARHLAETALKEGGSTPDSRLEFTARRLLARPLRPDEVRIAHGSLDELGRYYKEHPSDAKKLIAVGDSKADPALDASTLAAWTMLTNELMNLDEVLNK